MTSKIKENLLFYLSATKEKARSIAVNHNLDLRSETLIRLLVKNCRFTFDLLLVEGRRANYLTSEFRFKNVYSLCDGAELTMLEDGAQCLNECLNQLDQSIKGVHPDSCLLIDSVNLLLLNYSPIRLSQFISQLLSKYCKVIFLFNGDLVDADYLLAIRELATAYFELTRRPAFGNEIHAQYIYKKKCLKLGLDLVRGKYSFTFDTSTHLASKPIIEQQTGKQPNNEDYSYDISFNLTINDEERQQTVLPFMRYVLRMFLGTLF